MMPKRDSATDSMNIGIMLRMSRRSGLGKSSGVPGRGAVGGVARSLSRAAVLMSLALAAAGCERGSSASSTTAEQPIPATLMFGEAGLSPGQMNYPRAMDGDGKTLWVIDKAAQVQRFDAASGTFLGGWKLADHKFGKPAGVTVWRSGETEMLLVPETHYHRVTIYSIPTNYDEASGEPPIALRFGSFGNDPGQFVFPTDVAVLPTPDGRGIARLYVGEYGGNDRISIYDAIDPADISKGVNFKASFGSFGESATAELIQFNRPQSMEVDVARKRLVVNDACNHRVGTFTLDGALIAWFGSLGSEAGQFRYPYGLSLMDDGTALISEFEGARVQRVDLDRHMSMGTLGRIGRGQGELSNPWGVVALGPMAYVLDSGNHRVMQFRIDRWNQVATAGGTR
jgi:tripartite motif-containing protein 71